MGRLELLPRKKGKVRVRVVDESISFVSRPRIFILQKKMSLLDISLLLGTSLGEYPYEIVSQKEW